MQSKMDKKVREMLEAHGTTVLDTSSPEAQQKVRDEWNALMEGATLVPPLPPAQKGGR